MSRAIRALFIGGPKHEQEIPLSRALMTVEAPDPDGESPWGVPEPLTYRLERWRTGDELHAVYVLDGYGESVAEVMARLRPGAIKIVLTMDEVLRAISEGDRHADS